LSSNIFAQESLKSTKIIYDNGLDEVYKLEKVHDGYIAIGSKGAEATTKKLWLLKLNEKLELQSSKIIYSEQLESPFELLPLMNGNLLVLGQREQKELRSTVALCISSKTDILWAKNFGAMQHVEFSQAVQKQANEIILFGTEKHLLNEGAFDKLALLHLNMNGGILDSKQIYMGSVELDAKEIQVNAAGNLLLLGNLVDLDGIEVAKLESNPVEPVTAADTVYVELENGDIEMRIIEGGEAYRNYVDAINAARKKQSASYAKASFMIEISSKGKILHHRNFKDMQNFSFSSMVNVTDDGYILLLNPKDYFGDGLVVQLNKDLSVKQSKSFEGSPLLLSGLKKLDNKYVIAATFSNALGAYSPGFILLDADLEILSSKASKSLFSSFFITNISNEGQEFIFSGIGYEEGQASDIYFMPFTSSGKSACPLDEYQFSLKTQELKFLEMVEPRLTSKGLWSSDLSYAMKTDDKSTESNICTTPDDFAIDKEDNRSWQAWQNNNKDAFSIKIPENWLEIYPNPTKGLLTVEYSGMENEDGLFLTLMDVQGRIVLQRHIVNQDKFTINLSDFSSGIYNLKVFDGRKELIRRIELLD